jgi:hypothetical protein
MVKRDRISIAHGYESNSREVTCLAKNMIYNRLSKHVTTWAIEIAWSTFMRHSLRSPEISKIAPDSDKGFLKSRGHNAVSEIVDRSKDKKCLE